jgi:hypothetical protein
MDEDILICFLYFLHSATPTHSSETVGAGE